MLYLGGGGVDGDQNICTAVKWLIETLSCKNHYSGKSDNTLTIALIFKINITSERQMATMHPQIWFLETNKFTYVLFLPGIINLKLIRKHQTHPKWETFKRRDIEVFISQNYQCHDNQKGTDMIQSKGGWRDTVAKCNPPS